jgi:hypothetical protein
MIKMKKVKHASKKGGKTATGGSRRAHQVKVVHVKKHKVAAHKRNIIGGSHGI